MSEDTTRAEFEAWAAADDSAGPGYLTREADGGYFERDTELMWHAWQAAWAHYAPAWVHVMSSRTCRTLTTAEIESEREAFEAWARSTWVAKKAGEYTDWLLRTTESGSYVWGYVQELWLGWCARAALVGTAGAQATAQPADPLVRLSDVIAWLREREDLFGRNADGTHDKWPHFAGGRWALNRAAWTLECEPPEWAQATAQPAAWVPVAARLPEEGAAVLAVWSDQSFMGVQMLHLNGDLWSCPLTDADYDPPTHWMPLPPLPEPPRA